MPGAAAARSDRYLAHTHKRGLRNTWQHSLGERGTGSLLIELERKLSRPCFEGSVVELGRRHGLDCKQTALVLPQACTYFTYLPWAMGGTQQPCHPPSSNFLHPRCIFCSGRPCYFDPFFEPCGPALCRLDTPPGRGLELEVRGHAGTPAWTVDDDDDEGARTLGARPGRGYSYRQEARGVCGHGSFLRQTRRKEAACMAPLTRTGRTCTYRVARVRHRQGWWC
jgi:hypothetical protein